MRNNPVTLQSIVVNHQQTLQKMHNNAVANCQRLTHKVYNRQSRNIAKFIKQQRQFQKKNQQPTTNQSHQQQIVNKKRYGVTLRYDQNQVLELEFPKEIQPDQPKQEQQRSHSRSLRLQSTGFKQSGSKFMRSGKIGLKVNLLSQQQHKGPRVKSFSLTNPANRKNLSQHNNGSPLSPLSNQRKITARRRIATQFQVASSREQAPLSPKKMQNTYSNQSALIVMSRQKMQRYIRSLHRTAWMAKYLRGKPQNAQQSDKYRQHMRGFVLDRDSAIQSMDLNYMVARRYNLFSYYLEDVYDQRRRVLQRFQSQARQQKLMGPEEYLLLDSLSKQNILAIVNRKKRNNNKDAIQNSTQKQTSQTFPTLQQNTFQQKVYFSLPYSQFISQRQTKTSIYRIAGMNHNMCLRIAFSLYDKNRNGRIDQDDLMQAISLSRNMPQLQADIIAMSAVMMGRRIGNKSKLKREGTQPIRTTNHKLLSVQVIEVGSAISQNKGSMSDDEEQEQTTIASNSRFSIDKFYTLLKQKKELKKKAVGPIAPQQLAMPLTFTAFCKSFQHHKPAILYDLLRFLLGAQNEDFIDKSNLPVYEKRTIVKTEQNQEETLEEKWNNRLKHTNSILEQLITISHTS